MQKEAQESLNSAANQTQQTDPNAAEIVQESKKTQAYNAKPTLPKQDPKLTRRLVKVAGSNEAYNQVLDKKGNVVGYEDVNGNPIEKPVNDGPSAELVEMANDKNNGMKVSDSVNKINAEKAAGSTKYDTKESLMSQYDSNDPNALNWDDFYNRLRNLGLSNKEIDDMVVQNGYDKKYGKAGQWHADYHAASADNANVNDDAASADNANVNDDAALAVENEEVNVDETQPINTQQQQQKWNTRSVWQAWKDGEFGDPNTKDAKMARNYFLLNSLATFAQNSAERSANLANVYRGGQADASVGQNTSEWSDIQGARRQNALENELSSASALDTAGTNQTIAENYSSSDQRAQQLQNEYNSVVNKYADEQLRQQLKLTDKQIAQLEKLNANQDIQNQILNIQKNYTAQNAQALLNQITAAVGMTNAQTSLINKQTNWYDANEGLAALGAILKLFK